MVLFKTSTNILNKPEPLELILEIVSFSGGEDTIEEDQGVKSNEGRIIQNWDSIYLGGMIRSPGFTSVANQTASYTNKPIDGMLHHYEGTSVRNYAIVNGDLTRINGTALTVTDSAAFTAGALTHTLTASSIAYFTNSTDNLKYTTIGGSITVPTTKPTTACSRIYFHKSRLIGEGNQVTVYGSRAGAGNWNGAGGWTTSGDAFSIDMPDITQGCVPGFPNPDYITVFTERSTFAIYNMPNIAYRPIEVNRGCSAPYSVVYGKEGVFFVSKFPTLGVFLWDGTTFTNITLYEDFPSDINFSNRVFGTYIGNKYILMYSSIVNAQSYPDTRYEYDTRFGRWAQRPVNTALGDNLGYPMQIVKPSNALYCGSSRKAIVYQLESGNADASQPTVANYKTKDFSSSDFTVQGQGNLPLDAVRMKLLKLTISYYGTVGTFSFQWNADRGINSGSRVIDLTAAGDMINTTFIVNTSLVLGAYPPTKDVTYSFGNNAIGRRFNFQLLNTGSADRPKIKKIKIFAIALEEN